MLGSPWDRFEIMSGLMFLFMILGSCLFLEDNFLRVGGMGEAPKSNLHQNGSHRAQERPRARSSAAMENLGLIELLYRAHLKATEVRDVCVGVYFTFLSDFVEF